MELPGWGWHKPFFGREYHYFEATLSLCGDWTLLGKPNGATGPLGTCPKCVDAMTADFNGCIERLFEAQRWWAKTHGLDFPWERDYTYGAIDGTWSVDISRYSCHLSEEGKCRVNGAIVARKQNLTRIFTSLRERGNT